MSLVKCNKCGRMNAEGSHVCPYCGAQTKQDKSRRNKVYAIVAVLLAIFIVGGSIILFQSEWREDEAELFDKGIRYFDEKKYGEAVECFRGLAEKGDAEAQNYMGQCYHFGDLPQTDGAVEAVKWYSLAVAQGHPMAQYNLGVCYASGFGIQKNLAEALKLYRKSAEQGYAKAQYNLGYYYHIGEGIEKDFEKAVLWYRKAAKQGDVPAQNNLGRCYQFGEGVEENYEEAVKWYRRAADRGYNHAQCNLGECYELGLGVEQNRAEAIRWYQLAAEQGNSEATEALMRLKE